jgi:hypothetical protein
MEPLLLLGLGSEVSDRLETTLTMLVSVGGGTNLRLRVTALPLAKLAIAGKTIAPVVGLYVPPSDTVTPVKPGIRLSVMTTLAATLGPLLLVVIV